MGTLADIDASEALGRVGWTLRRADLAVQAAKERSLKPVGLSTSQYSLLMHVHVYPGLNGAELSRHMSITAQAVALLAGKLETAGLLRRQTHPRHRHIQEFVLTEDGHRRLEAAYSAVGQVEAQLHSVLGARDTTHLSRLLDKILEEFQSP